MISMMWGFEKRVGVLEAVVVAEGRLGERWWLGGWGGVGWWWWWGGSGGGCGVWGGRLEEKGEFNEGGHLGHFAPK